MRGTEERLGDLELQVGELSGDLRVLRTLIGQDSASALNKIRYITEKVLHTLCSKNEVSWGKQEPTLENMIGPLVATKIIPKNVAVHIRTIQTNASPGSHYQEAPLTGSHVQVAQIALIDLLEWYYRGAEPSGAFAPATEAPAQVVRRASSRMTVAIVVIAVAAAVIAAVLGREEPKRPPDVVPPPPALRAPEAGLAAIARYEHPKGEAADLASATFWQAAARDFEEASRQLGSPPRWQAGRRFADAQLALLEGERDRAIEELEKAIALEPTWAILHASRSIALTRKEDYEAALEAAAEAQRLDSSSWVWIAFGARVHRSRKALDDAVREYRRALSLAPKEPILLAELALVFHAMRLDSEAERYARDALAIDEDMVPPRVLLAERALEGRDGKAALAEAERAVSVSPQSVAALLALADAQMLLGRREEARATYGRMLSEWDRLQTKGASEERIELVREALARGKLPGPRRGERSRATAKPSTDRSRGPAHDPLLGLDDL